MNNHPYVRGAGRHLGNALLLALASGVLGSFPGDVGPAAAAPVPAAPAPGNKPYTATYNVADLIQKSNGKPGYASVEDLIRALMAVAPQRWRAAEKNARTLTEVNGTRLEVRATAAEHADIKSLLDTFRRLNEVTVAVHTHLYEIDEEFYRKEIRPRLEGGKGEAGRRAAWPVEDELAERIRKRATPVKANREEVGDRKGAKVFSLRRAFTYLAKPPGGATPDGGYATAFYGLSVKASVRVSSDRRRVRMRITQDVTDLIEVGKKKVRDESGDLQTVDAPDLVESSTSATVNADDGLPVLVAVRYRPATLKKGRMLLMLVRPVILIEEEEREKRKGVS